MGARSRFSRRELERLPSILALAEDLTGSYFKISSFEPERYPFEVATRRHLEHHEIDRFAFAQVCRYDALNLCRAGRGLQHSLYRICVQDHNVLRALRRDGDRVSLDALLLYVLTHELCHVIRFCSYQQLFEADPRARHREEERVHDLTRAILARRRDATLDRVVSLYHDHCG